MALNSAGVSQKSCRPFLEDEIIPWLTTLFITVAIMNSAVSSSR